MKVTGSSSATVTLTKVTINNVANTALASALRVAILKEDGSLLAIVKPTGATDRKYLSATGTYAQSGSAYTAIESGTAISSNNTVGTVTDSGNNFITIRVFLDGEDSATFSQNISSTDMSQVMSGLVVELNAA